MLKEQDKIYIVKRLPKVLREFLKESAGAVFLAGGFIRSVICGEKINDIDLFVRSKAEALAKTKVLSSSYYESKNAYSFDVDNYKVQIIHRWTFSTPADCCKSFDFTVAQSALWYSEGRWESYCHSDFYSDLAAKRLVYTSPERNEDAGGSILRVLKFYQLGYRIPLPSFGAVIARLMQGVDMNKLGSIKEETQLAKVLTGLLVEVDPNIAERIYYEN